MGLTADESRMNVKVIVNCRLLIEIVYGKSGSAIHSSIVRILIRESAVEPVPE
jgi:hypothetical protein